MANEQNPFGGAPFGGAPFGPKIPSGEPAAEPTLGWFVPFDRAGKIVSIALAAALVMPLMPAEGPAETPFGWYRPFALPAAGSAPLYYQVSTDVVKADLPASISTPFVSLIGTDVQFQRTLYYQATAWCPQPIAEASNTGTVDTWLTRWQGPPKYVPPKILAQPFVPREAVLENTVTPDAWLRAWRGPPRYWPIKVEALPFVPKEAVLENIVTPEKWLLRWQGPPRYLLSLLGGSPFVPKEATLENTVDQGWRVAFVPAAPAPKPRHTQPVFGYPYGVAVNLTTSIEWLTQWKGPPRYLPPKIAAQPFVPREAVLDNTVDQGWRVPFVPAAPVAKPRPTQPFYGYPYEAQSNLTTSIEWLTQWKGPPRYQPAKILAQPFVPKEAVLENTVTPDTWWQQLGKIAVRYFPPKRPAQPFVPREATLENTVTPDKWHQPFARRPVFTHPRFADVIYTAQPPVFVENTVTIEKWMVPLGQTPKKPQWMAARQYLQWPYQVIIQIPMAIERPPNRIITFLHESRRITFKRSSRIITFLKRDRTVT